MKKIIFVCTGNTCRSPMAMAIFNSLAKNSGLDWQADSAGLAAYGDPINENSVKALAKIGIHFSNYTSKSLNFYMIDEAELIVVMTQSHLNTLLSYGVSKEKLRLLGQGISDPFGGDEERYVATRDEILSAVKQLMAGEDFK